MAGGRGHRGATPSVVRTLEGRDAAPRDEATCHLCKSLLQFDTIGEYSQLIERCSGTNNPCCPNRRWHRPAVAHQLPPDPPTEPKKRRGRKPSTPSAPGDSFGRYSDA